MHQNVMTGHLWEVGLFSYCLLLSPTQNLQFFFSEYVLFSP